MGEGGSTNGKEGLLDGDGGGVERGAECKEDGRRVGGREPRVGERKECRSLGGVQGAVRARGAVGEAGAARAQEAHVLRGLLRERGPRRRHRHDALREPCVAVNLCISIGVVLQAVHDALPHRCSLVHVRACVKWSVVSGVRGKRRVCWARATAA